MGAAPNRISGMPALMVALYPSSILRFASAGPLRFTLIRGLIKYLTVMVGYTSASPCNAGGDAGWSYGVC